MSFTLEQRRVKELPAEIQGISRRMLILGYGKFAVEYDPHSRNHRSYLIDLEADLVPDLPTNDYLNHVKRVIGDEKFSELEKTSLEGTRSVFNYQGITIETATRL